MGDFADMALSDTMDAEDDRLLFRMGGMSDADAYELGIIDERGVYAHPPMFRRVTLSRAKTCKHCGTDGLRWGETASGWRLHGTDGVHSCGAYKQ